MTDPGRSSCVHRQPYGLLQAISVRNKIYEGENYDGRKLYVRRCKRCHGWFLTTRWINALRTSR